MVKAYLLFWYMQHLLRLGTMLRNQNHCTSLQTNIMNGIIVASFQMLLIPEYNLNSQASGER